MDGSGEKVATIPHQQKHLKGNKKEERQEDLHTEQQYSGEVEMKMFQPRFKSLKRVREEEKEKEGKNSKKRKTSWPK